MDIVSLIDLALQRHSPKEVAIALGVSARTVRRWHLRETDPPAYVADAIRQRLLNFPEIAHAKASFRFIDLFAGIGGMRMAFEAHGGHCVFSSEWDDYACKTYSANFPHQPGHRLVGDITQIDERDVPNHEVLLAGFPCQPFSIAGVSKKNALGRPHGFSDKTQGTLFFDVARIIAEKQPKAFLLENVKNLVGHDKGRTFSTILDVLRNDLGYDVHAQVINGKHFVPQNRERIIIVGFREPVPFSWDELRLPPLADGPKLASILHPGDGSEPRDSLYLDGQRGEVSGKYTLSDKLWAYLQSYATKHREKGNGFGFGLVRSTDTARTLSARYYKDGSEILIDQGPSKNPRRLTPRECARLMGFPDDFIIPVSDTQAYKLFSEAAVVPMIEAVAKYLVTKLPVQSAVMNDAIEPSKKAFSTTGNWTREQLKLAFHFYCQTPFGKLHAKNPEIVKLAALIGRSPSALAMKLGNFASLDPAVTQSGRKGLSGASLLDREIWQEFHANWEGLIEECEVLRAYLSIDNSTLPSSQIADADFASNDFIGETRAAVVKQRLKQAFFRRAVLNSYGQKCCISGVTDMRFLVASHIVAWRDDISIRLHPGNGLCLSTIHDRAFDGHLFSLTDDRRVILSAQLTQTKDHFLRQIFWPINDMEIALPEKFSPEVAFISRHREKMMLFDS